MTKKSYTTNRDQRTPQRAGWRRAFVLGIAAPALSLLVLGCSGQTESKSNTLNPDSAGQTNVSLNSLSGQNDGASAAIPASARVDEPSKSALMVCGPDLQLVIEKTLALPALPQPTSTWSNQLYTCTYPLEGGPLVLKVKELPDAATAQQYFAGLSQHIGPGDEIQGVASFGLPGFKSTSGLVIFAKDNMTLQIDATHMSEQIGPNGVSRADFAYQVSTNVLACWTGP